MEDTGEKWILFMIFVITFGHYRFHKISKTIPDYIWKKGKEANKATKISKAGYALQATKKARLSALYNNERFISHIIIVKLYIPIIKDTCMKEKNITIQLENSFAANCIE